MYFIYRSAAWAKSVSSGDSNYPTAAILLALASQDGTRICVTDRCGTRQAFGSGACVYLEQNPEGWSVGNASHFSVGAHYSFFFVRSSVCKALVLDYNPAFRCLPRH